MGGSDLLGFEARGERSSKIERSKTIPNINKAGLFPFLLQHHHSEILVSPLISLVCNVALELETFGSAIPVME